MTEQGGATIEPKDRADIYIGLVGAAGTDLEPIKSQLKAHFSSYDYTHHEVKVSHLIRDFLSIDVKGLAEDQRVRALMDGGDKIRQLHGIGDGVVTLMVSAIKALRPKRSPDETGLGGACVFIIDSLKNPNEIKTLDKIYGRNFYAVSVYASENERITKFANRIAESIHTNAREEHITKAKEAIKEDERRDATDLSQDVLNTFPKGDFFVAVNGEADTKIKRFVDLIFGDPFITPTVDEYAMFTAKAVSLRSADLSRQVGAAIMTEDGTILATGFNEVPYPGGGTWVEGRQAPDNRDHVVEFDPNSSEISNIFRELVGAFSKAEILSDQATAKGVDALVEELLHGEWRKLTIDARVRNLIEFGRVVHAEMHALAEAARTGRAVFSMRPRKGKFGAVVRFNRARALPVGAVQGVSQFMLEKYYHARLDEIKGILTTSTEGEFR